MKEERESESTLINNSSRKINLNILDVVIMGFSYLTLEFSRNLPY